MDSKIFFEFKPDGDNYIQIFGLLNKKRTFMWVKRDYVLTPINFEKYKLMISKASGSGKFGETLSTMVIGTPKVGHTQSFISIGNFDTEIEVLNLEKYIKSKFCRCLLSILRTTQDTTVYKWRYVPLQDFTLLSDIDWSGTVHSIDLQLYKKYGLTNEEILFIETNVKEMN